MIKWKLKEEFDQQDERFKAIRARYDSAVTAAGTHLQDLKAENEALMRREFAKGDDLSADKAKVRERIADAEKALEAAELERAQAYEYARVASADRITVRDLVVNWNGEYMREVREKELQPIVDRMAAARSEYYNAVLDYAELIDEYRWLYEMIRDMGYEDDKKRPGDGIHVHAVDSPIKLPRITNAELVPIDDRRQLPDGIKRAKGGEKK